MNQVETPRPLHGQSIEERTKEALNLAPFVVGGSVSGRLSEADRHRLVKASKCPTGNLEPGFMRDNAWIVNQFGQEFTEKWLQQRSSPKYHRIQQLLGAKNERAITELHPTKERVGWIEADLQPLRETGEIKRQRENLEGAGKFAVITRREWSEEFRVRVEVELPHGQPPEQSGSRETETLTMRGARAIADSCHYMALEKGGYSTFLTLTLDDAARQRVAAGEKTVQKEISRFFDAAQKMYQRGWVNDATGNELPGHDSPLAYCWVVENPKNAQGEDNPHAHILMKWRVPYREFEGWASRVEKLWGQGFAHLEKIKEPEKAGAYMAKAAGYLTKASGQDDQGKVRGNRYGISKVSRAPGWVQVGRFEAGIMGSLIKDTHDYFTHLYGHHFKERTELNQKLSETPKGDKKRQAIGKRLEKVRAVLNKLPAIASKHQITLKGWGAYHDFMSWAQSDQEQQDGAWLPGKDQGDNWQPNDNQTSYRHKLGQSITGYFARLKRRKWERETGGDLWWSAMMRHFSQWQLMPKNTDRQNYENWGFV